VARERATDGPRMVRICPKCGYRAVGVDATCPNYPWGRIGGLCGYDLSDVVPTEAVEQARAERRSRGDSAKRFALAGLMLGVLLFVAGVTYEHWSRWRAPRKFPPPGELVEVDDTFLHLNCTGEGTPTVILESGAGSPSVVWMAVQDEIAQLTRVCSYDRAGLGWSERKQGPRDAGKVADELHVLLGTASIEPPYVMVGHSFGGPRIMIFAHRFPGEVAGFVFVDTTDPELEERLPPELAALAEAQGSPSTFLYSALAATGVLRALGRLTAGAPGGWPSEIVEVARAFGPVSLTEALREIKSREETLGLARKLGPIGDIPIIVLTAGRLKLPESAEMTPELEKQLRDLRLELQGELAALSTNSDHRIIQSAAHFIQIDEPGAVVTAVSDVLTAVREGERVRWDERR